MKKSRIYVAMALVAVMAGWLLYTYEGSKSEPLTELERKVLDVQDDRLTKGDTTAPVKIVEYADILCPYCAKANEQVIPQIQTNYIDKKLVHYEVRLVAMTAPDSQRAGEGAYCAAEQNKFWNYIDVAYKDTWNNYYSQNKSPEDVRLFSEQNIYSFASRVGLDELVWEQCMDSGKYKETILDNQNKMNEIKAYGTPHFIINGNNYSGAPPYTSFEAVIDVELNKLKAS